MISIIRRKINAKTLMGQSSALKSNTEFLKKNVGNLAKVLREKNKIRPSSLMGVEEKSVVEQKRIGPGEYDKKEGGGLPNLLPLLAGLGALGATAGLAMLNPRMFLRRFGKAVLKAFLKLFTKLAKIFKGIFETVGRVFKKIFNAIADNVKKLKNLIDDKLLKPLREAFESALESKWFKKLRAFFDDITESIKNFIKNSAERFKTFADDVFKRVKTFADNAIEGAITAFKKILDDIVDNILKPLKSAVLEFVDRTKKFLTEGIQGIGQGIAERVGKESFGEVIELVSDIFLKNFDNTVDGIVDFVRKPVIGLLDQQAFGVKVANIPIVGDGLRGILGGLNDLSSNVKSAVREIPRQIGGLLDDVRAGNTPVQKAFGFVAKQFDPEVIKRRFGKGLDFIQGVGSQVRGTLDTMAEGLSQLNIVEQAGKFKDDMIAGVGGFIGDLKNSVSNAIKGQISGIFSGGTQTDIIKQAEPAIDKIKDAKPVLDALEGAKKQGDKVFDLFGPLKNGWREATGKFDQLFALAEFAVSYGSAIDAQRREAEGGPPAKFMGKDIAGQTMGDAILSVLGAFGGSAIGSSLGTQVGATIGAAVGAPVFGVGAAVGAGVGGSLFGFLGSVLGGIIGEDVGKLVASEIGKNYKIPDPFLKGRNLFSTEGASDLTLLGMFGLGAPKPEEEPQGGIYASGLPPRNFALLQTEMDYNVKTEVVVMKSKEIINNSAVATAGSSGGGGYASPMIIKTGGSALNNYKSRTLAQLS